MPPMTYQQGAASRRSFVQMKAFLIAFGVTLVATAIALGIWDDVPQTTNELEWSEVPVVRIWTFLLVLLGTPILTVLLSLVMPAPAGQTLTVDDIGIRRQSPIDPTFWRWSDIDRIDLYPHPDKKSFIRVSMNHITSDSRIVDIYGAPIQEIFDRLLSVQQQVAGDRATPDSAELVADRTVTFDADPRKQVYRTYFFTFVAMVVVFEVLHGVFEIPRLVSLGVIAVTLPVVLYQAIGIVRTLLSGGWQRLILDESGLSLVEGQRHKHVSWPDIGDIQVHGKTGFWATPRYISLDVPQGSHWDFLSSLLGKSRIVIPDAFLASMDEIADRLRAFHDRMRQAGI